MTTTFLTRFITYVTGRTIASATAFRLHGSRVLSMRLAATAYAWRAAQARTMFTTGSSPGWTGTRNRPTVTASPFGPAERGSATAAPRAFRTSCWSAYSGTWRIQNTPKTDHPAARTRWARPSFQKNPMPSRATPAVRRTSYATLRAVDMARLPHWMRARL